MGFLFSEFTQIMTEFTLDSKLNKTIFRWMMRVFIYSNLLAIFLLPAILNPVDQYQIGKLFGTMAAIAFLVSQIPGLLRRYSAQGFFRQFGNLLMYSRAHIGTLMFLLATVHYLLLFVLPTIRDGFTPPDFFTFFGIISFYLCFPLFVTSNDWSKKKLKRNWGRLHKLTYFILWSIFVHVALAGGAVLAGVLMFFGIFQIGSFVYAKSLKVSKN